MKFSKTHEWVKIDGNKAVMGISDFAQSEMGDIVYVSLPKVGDKLVCEKCFAEVESVKAVSEVMSCVCGTVTEVNAELENAPELINEKPYEAWLVKAEISGSQDGLMTEEEYLDFIK